MPSTHEVKLTKIEKILPHPNADKLEIAKIDGWQVVVQKGTFAEEDRVVFVPVDSVVPSEWADKWGVRSYLGGSNHDRVRCVKLRGEPSYGFAISATPDANSHPELETVPLGTDVKNLFGITKYEPPVRQSNYQGKPRKSHPLFPKYTNIENLRNNKNVFEEDEEIIVTEKIHGCNTRVGLVNSTLPKPGWWNKLLRKLGFNRMYDTEEWVAGSHNVQRKVPDTWEDCAKSPYTFMLSFTNIREFIVHLKNTFAANQVIVFGEVFGPSVQKLHYGVKEGYEFRIVDVMIDGKYCDWERVMEWAYMGYCGIHEGDLVPVLYRGPYVYDTIEEVCSGQTVVNRDSKHPPSHIKEGGVIKPVYEDTYGKNYKRKVFKYKNADYLIWKDSKQGSDYTEN